MMRIVCLLALCLASLTACEREQRRYNAPASPASPASDAGLSRMGPFQPGPAASAASGASSSAPIASAASAPASAASTSLPPTSANPHEENAVAVAEGKRVYRWYNCNGCHATGGGSLGPALMDDEWLYGHEPQQIVATILQGRPNGMPAFAARIPEDQVWKIAAYVRSMSGQLRSDVAPSRSDGLSAGPPEQRRDKETPKPAAPGKDH